MREMCTKNRTLSQLGAEKIAFSPKYDRQANGQTDRWTDISNNIVALLLITRKGFLSQNRMKNQILQFHFSY